MSSKVIEEHAELALNEIKLILKSKWESLTDAQKKSASRASKRMIQLEWKQRVEGADVSEDLEFVKGTIEDFKLAGQLALYDAFWEGINKAFKVLGSFLMGAGSQLIPGLGALKSGINLAEVFNVDS